MAQAYPARPVKFMVGFAPGGPNDTLGRIAADWLTKQLGQPFEVENRSGRSGNIATEAVVKAAPDGYTILLCGPANQISGSLYSNLPFNFLRDIAPVVGITREALVMVVHPSVPAKTVPEFIAYAKANPGKVTMASTGNGSSPHVTGELFKLMAGLPLPVVHYPGGGPALKAMIEGKAEMMFEPMSASIGPVRSGKLRALAVTTTTRSSVLPDVPILGRLHSRLRGERHDRHRRAARHAGRDHRDAQQGDERGLRRSGDEGEARRHRRRSACPARRRISAGCWPPKPRNGARW